jgi:hypothetical protein
MRIVEFIVLAAGLAGQVQQPAAPAQPAPGGPPATEVYVASLTTTGTTWTVGKPENISNAPGYDNQPFFVPDGGAVLFTSDRVPAAERTLLKEPAVASKVQAYYQQVPVQLQTDIFRYDLASRAVTRVTRTMESEYSPTVTPDGKGISVIRVERDQTQRLWRFTRDGQQPTLILKDVMPVGYHAWLDEGTLALFVLGPPATLQVADTRTGTAQVVATDIGQSVQRIPSGGVSFVQQGPNGPTISRLAIEGGKPVTTPLTAPVPGARQAHLAWTPDGTLLMAHSGWLHAWKPGDKAWRAVADLEALGLKGVTRLAVSPKGDRIAIVAQ